MSDTKTDQTNEQKTPVTGPAPDNGPQDGQTSPEGESPSLEDWKRHARTWEDRSKQHKAESEAKDARIATLEKALEDGTDATEALTTSRAQAARYRAALDAGMDAATADAVLTATDPEQIEAQAAAFKAAVDAAVGKSAERAPREPVPESPNQGAPGPAKPDYRAQADRIRNMR